ncbi:hypothetical protein JYU34_006779 [Plutella xylostella]|uniref:Nuclear respiratory factor 1 NLS/DNA-binding dimerisation domain-containing protein n=1 Tax=Plutella xylostella TaxID=51655 RepID=A0ABQ7QST9_PLUXY|nr:hypothetical protein JYU34_006779 [Plutella xylostella]
MIANLPLLFANGNPTALTKITASELEKFITFMVTCSWGHDTAKDIRQPPWWPDDVAFSHPFKRPPLVPREWENKLKRLVRRCYDYHKSAFLLVFSAQLARYPHNRLRYVDNLDHTTSLYCKPSGKLLVTFRNENLHYDRNGEANTTVLPSEPQLKSADIYLCDNCDSHFDNPDILQAHERLCNNVINVPSTSISGGLPEFLSALKLKPIEDVDKKETSTENDMKSRHVRSAANIDRGPPYPFSSLAYIRNAKSICPRDTSYSRERVERYCCDTPTTYSKNLGSKRNSQFPVRYRRPIDYWTRKHVFPDQRKKDILNLDGQLLMLKCRPISVNIENMALESMQDYIDKLKEEAKLKAEEDKDVECLSDDDSEKTTNPLNTVNECEVIDLCSDDETASANENCDPRAGVTCVMRGGAVLRRTAATPQAIPAEPCGARQKPLPPAILQPQPVILFTHSLSNMQTISID